MRMRNASRGFTLVELASVMIIVAVMAAAANVAYQDIIMVSEVEAVSSTQAVLQSVISQASARLEVSPQALCIGTTAVVNGVPNTTVNGNRVVLALPTSGASSALGDDPLRITWLAGTQFKATLENSGRYALYNVMPNGDVVVTSAPGFSGYSVVGGKLVKS